MNGLLSRAGEAGHAIQREGNLTEVVFSDQSRYWFPSSIVCSKPDAFLCGICASMFGEVASLDVQADVKEISNPETSLKSAVAAIRRILALWSSQPETTQHSTEIGFFEALEGCLTRAFSTPEVEEDAFLLLSTAKLSVQLLATLSSRKVCYEAVSPLGGQLKIPLLKTAELDSEEVAAEDIPEWFRPHLSGEATERLTLQCSKEELVQCENTSQVFVPVCEPGTQTPNFWVPMFEPGTEGTGWKRVLRVNTKTVVMSPRLGWCLSLTVARRRWTCTAWRTSRRRSGPSRRSTR